jgi:hypothetical protein
MEKSLILIDSHVHIYDCYNIKRFFYSALTNFTHSSTNLGCDKFIGILFLTETRNDNYFQALKKKQFDFELKELNLKKIETNELNSVAYQSNNNYLIIISGKQIITSENLEVLALGTTDNLNYGGSLKDSIEKINSIGALPVLPWGVGKWLGRREKIIKDFLENKADMKYFLGDNGGRPIFWSTPGMFEVAEGKGIAVLRGSDPLPLSFQEEKVGKFGFYTEAILDLDYPAKDISSILLNLEETPNNIGSLETPMNFFKNQFSMQIRKLF